jgi:type II secretory pathway pseudopilin PulG
MELLVVISIIGLLATVILSQVSVARVKARNTGQIRQVQQYIRALEFGRDASGGYPTVSGVNTFSCLGVGYTGGTCGAGSVAQSESLNTNINAALLTYIPAMPIGGTTASNFEGFIYREFPDDASGGANTATGYRIRYALDGNSGCTAGSACTFCQLSNTIAVATTDTTVTTCEFTYP